MTNEKVIQLAKKAGLLAHHDQWLWSERRLLQFAELVEDEVLRSRDGRRQTDTGEDMELDD